MKKLKLIIAAGVLLFAGAILKNNASFASPTYTKEEYLRAKTATFYETEEIQAMSASKAMKEISAEFNNFYKYYEKMLETAENDKNPNSDLLLITQGLSDAATRANRKYESINNANKNQAENIEEFSRNMDKIIEAADKMVAAIKNGDDEAYLSASFDVKSAGNDFAKKADKIGALNHDKDDLNKTTFVFVGVSLLAAMALTSGAVMFILSAKREQKRK